MAAGPIRVLNLFTIMNRGGAETMVMNYYRNMDRSKVQYDFMVHRQERGAYEDEIEALGGRIFRVPPVRPWSAHEYKRMVRAFYREHLEYKVIHSHMSELGYYDFIEAEKAGVPVRICHAHNRPYGLDLKSPVRWYYKTMMRAHITDLFTCGVESAEWLFGAKNKSRFVQLNNAIDAKQYVYRPQLRQSMRQALGIAEDQLVIGHVGRFDPQKNHGFLIDVFANVHKQNEKALLVLVGDDSHSGGMEIHEKVAQLGLTESVKFLGIRSDVADVLQAMDVFLFPSLFEGFGIAALEAQASGLATLVSERIPEECMITNLIQREMLKTSAAQWATTVLELAQIPRRDTYEEIKAAGFDIAENAKWLQEFYLQAAQR